MSSVIVLGQRQVVAELDATIARVEGQRREQLAAGARLAARGRGWGPGPALAEAHRGLPGLPAPGPGRPALGAAAGGAPPRRGTRGYRRNGRGRPPAAPRRVASAGPPGPVDGGRARLHHALD